jgi:hypothetical protein
MQYIGGKQKSGGQHIARIVAGVAKDLNAGLVEETCCGGLSITYRLAKLGCQVNAADACEALITLYQAWQGGWRPQLTHVSRELWETYRANPDPSDPMTALVGFGCSRSGAWFSSYIETYKYTNRHVTPLRAAVDSLTRKLQHCGYQVRFTARDYQDTPPGVIYADIPFAGTVGYPAVGPFDHATFWEWARARSLEAPVFVSERVAPSGWLSVHEQNVQVRLATGAGSRAVAHLYVHEIHRDLFPHLRPLRFAAV